MGSILFIPLGAGLLALLVGAVLIAWVLGQPTGNEEMVAISHAVQAGAMAYLNRQYRTVAMVAVVLFVIIGLGLSSWLTAVYFLIGAVLSASAGYAGMNVAVRSNVRTARAAEDGLGPALRIAVRGGAVTGLFVAGLGLIGTTVLYSLSPHHDMSYLVGLGFGASLISAFARLGGGIYTKAADVGADLVGKVEAGIPEDDPRNPAVIADNVGDNVGDNAGMAADLFETYVVTSVAAMLLGFLEFHTMKMVVFPLILGGISVVSSVIGILFLRTPRDNRGIMGSLYGGVWANAVLALIGFYFANQYFTGRAAYFWSAVVGLAVTVALMYITDYFTSSHFHPVRGIAEASQTGHATNIIAGLAVGMKSTALPVLAIVIGILVAYGLGGVYGVGIAAMALVSLTGMVVTLDSYGPITDNAGGIAEMAHRPESVRKVTDALDAVGNTTKAVTKGYAIGSAALAAIVLFSSFTRELPGHHAINFSIASPAVLVGLFLGGILPFLFSALTMEAVGRAAFSVVEEVRRQFREIKGLMEGKAKPDYARAVDIVTRAALREMILPALLPVLSPVVVGFLLGPRALGGLLVGSIVTGLFLAIQMTAGGGAWDNAKKYIEEGNFGGKGTPTHAAAVTGDTVGDPFKDTAGPAINPMIKILNIVSLLIAPLLGSHLLHI